MELPDSNLFILDVPVWTVVESDGRVRASSIDLLDKGIGIPRGRNDDGEDCFVIFTDEDMADRFIRDWPGGFRHPIKIKLEAWAALLHSLQQAHLVGFVRLDIDWEKGHGVQTQRLTDAISAIRARSSS